MPKAEILRECAYTEEIRYPGVAVSFFSELKRRNVIKVGVLYIVASWLILQVAELLFDALALPAEWLRLVLALLLLAFPVVLIFSWAYELTPEGVKREKDVDRSQSITHQTGARINTLIVVLLVLAIAAVALDRMVPEEAAIVVEAPVPTASPGPPENSIAVLPFADLSPEGDQEYFSDGIAEEILNVLVRVEGLIVASRTTSWGFKGQESLGIPFMAEKMNVRHVLEGSVRKAGDTVRITAQLIDAETDQHLWSDTFDRELTTESIFAIQDDIAGAIGAQLGVIIDPAVNSQKASTGDLDAYELYLEANQLFIERRDLERAVTLLEQAVSLDPEFAHAWASLAAISSVAPSWNYRERDYFALALDAANRAIDLNPDLAMPYAVVGNLRANYGPDPQWEYALEQTEKALALDPKEATIVSWRAMLLMVLGYFDQAEQDFLRCLEIDPAYENCSSHLALTLLFKGDIDSALALHADNIRRGDMGNSYPFLFVYHARGDDLSVAIAIASWNDAVGLQPATEFEYRALTDPHFDYEEIQQQIEAIYASGGTSWLGWSLWNGDYWFWYREYDKVIDFAFPYFWFPYPREYRESPERKRLMRDLFLPDYWREHGFPPHCRPVGDDDFECD